MQSLLNQSFTITTKGQVTIPVSLRKKLGVKPGAKVYFEAGSDHIKLKPVEYSLDEAYASIGPLKKRLSLKEVRRIALEDKLLKDQINEAR